MKIFRVLTNQELRHALSHVHFLAHVSFAEREGDEMGPRFQDPERCTVNRLADSLPFDDPDRECWIDGETGSEPVIGVVIDSEGILLLLDRAQSKPFAEPKP